MSPDEIAGYARYRIDFEDMDLDDKYALGWASPRYPECEAYENLEKIKGWWTGWNREIWQEDIHEVVPFKVSLYRIGLKGELGLLDSAEYEDLQPA
jgi:hypothetical protein